MLPQQLLALILFFITSLAFPSEIYAAPATVAAAAEATAATAAAETAAATDKQQEADSDEVMADTSDFTNNLLLKNISDVVTHLKEQQEATEAAVDAAAAEAVAAVKAEQVPQKEPEKKELLDKVTADSVETSASDRTRLAQKFEKVVPVASPAGSAVGTSQPLPYKSERNDVISGASPHNADQNAIGIDPDNPNESHNQMLQSYAHSPAYAPVYKDRERNQVSYVRQSRDDMLLNTMVHIHINHIAKAQNLINQWRNEDINRFFAQEQVQALFANKRHSHNSVVSATTQLATDNPEQAQRQAENAASAAQQTVAANTAAACAAQAATAAGGGSGDKGANVSAGFEPGLKDQIGQLYNITDSGYAVEGSGAYSGSINDADSYERAFYEQDLEVRIRQDLDGSFATAESGEIRGHELTADHGAYPPRSSSSLNGSLSSLRSKAMAQAYRYDNSDTVNQNRGIARVVKDNNHPVYIDQDQALALSSKAVTDSSGASTEDIVIDAAGNADSQDTVDIAQTASGYEITHLNQAPAQLNKSSGVSWAKVEHMGIAHLDTAGSSKVVDPMSYPSVTFKADADQIENVQGDTSNVVSSLAQTRYLAVSASTPYIPEKYQPQGDRLKLLNNYEDTVSPIHTMQNNAPLNGAAAPIPGSTSSSGSEAAVIEPTGDSPVHSVASTDINKSTEPVPLPRKPPLHMGKVGNAASELVSEAKNRLAASLFGDDEDAADSEELKAADVRLVNPAEKELLTNSLLSSTNNVLLEHEYDRASFYVDGRESVSSHAAVPEGKGRMPSIKARHGRKIVFLTKPDGLDAFGRPIPPFAEEHGDYIRYCRQYLKYNGNNNQYGTFIYGTNTLQHEAVPDDIPEPKIPDAVPVCKEKEAEGKIEKIKVDAITGE